MHPMWDNLFRGDRNKKAIFITLKNNTLFKDLSDSQIRAIQNLVNVRHYRAGEIVFQSGEVGVGMYMIAKGTVDIFVEEADSNKNYLTKLEENDFFGEMALVEEDGRRTASVVCREDCTLVGFFKPDLSEVISRSPEAGVKILFRLSQMLAARLNETTSIIKTLQNRATR